MKVYTLSEPGGGVDPGVWWQRVARCWSAGLLTDADTVWGRPTHSLPVLRVLRAGRAECWWLLEPDVAGYVRLGADRARWAPTYDGTRDAPAAALKYSVIPGGVATDRIVVVVAHRHRTDRVGVVARSRRVSVAGGVARCPVTGTTVIDLPAYQPLTGRAPDAVVEFESVVAAAGGHHLLVEGLPPATRRADLDALMLDIPADGWREIGKAHAAVTEWAEQVAVAGTAGIAAHR